MATDLPLRTVKTNIVQSIRAFSVADLQFSAAQLGYHFLYANLLVLPNLDSANIAYNLLKTAAGGNIAIGPVLLGAAKPVQILTASTTVRRIVNMTAITVADINSIK